MNVMEAALERSASLLPAETQAELRTMADGAGLSIGAFLLRTMNALDPELAQSVQSLDAVATQLHESSQSVMAAIDEAGTRVSEFHAQQSSLLAQQDRAD